MPSARVCDFVRGVFALAIAQPPGRNSKKGERKSVCFGPPNNGLKLQGQSSKTVENEYREKMREKPPKTVGKLAVSTGFLLFLNKTSDFWFRSAFASS